MAQSSWPSPGASRAVTDAQYEQLASPQYVDGLIGNPADTAAISADGATRQVTVRSGLLAQLRGHGWASGTTATVLSIAANGSASSRTDLVVLGLNRSTWDITAYVKTGTPGSGAPTLQLDAGSTGIYEMPLAEVTVPAGATAIAITGVKARAWYARPPGSASGGIDTRPPNPTPGALLWESGTTYVWNGSAWERISNLPAPAVTRQITDLSGDDINGDNTWRDFASAVWAPCSLVVPLSGRIKITVSGWVEHRSSTLATLWLSYRTTGGGTTAGTTSSTMNPRGISTRGSRIIASKTSLFTGLVPGATVTCIPAYFGSPASSDPIVTTIRDSNILMEAA